MTQEEIDRFFTVKDKQGNGFFCRNGKITLRLSSEDKERKIGEVYYKGTGLVYKKYEDESTGIFRKTNSWSIPYFIYEKIDKIWFYTLTADYRIAKKDAPSAEFLHFRNSGYEKKIYIPIKYWNYDNRT